MPVNWLGDQVVAKMRAAQVDGVNATMAAATTHAKRNHTWQNRTATLEGSIGVAEPAAPAPSGGVRGTWGSRDVRYALIHEVGGIIRPVRARALAIPQPDGSVRLVKEVTIPERPYLRPAADVEYPKLATHIRRAFERKGGGS